jgi:hypothetical protein
MTVFTKASSLNRAMTPEEALQHWQVMLDTLRAWERANPELAAQMPWAEARIKWEAECGKVEFDPRMLTQLTYINNRENGLRQALHDLFYRNELLPHGSTREAERKRRKADERYPKERIRIAKKKGKVWKPVLEKYKKYAAAQ